MQVWPVIVPSKGRPRGRTFELLRAAQVPYAALVEPQDVSAYRAHHGTVVALGDNDRGIAFARNGALALATGWFWMLDDDITALQVRQRPADAQLALAAAQEMAPDDKLLALFGLEYRQFAWAAKQPIVHGSYADVAVAVNAPLLKRMRISYDEALRQKVDRDIAIQCLTKGLAVARCTAVSFSCPKNGSNSGGLHAAYHDGTEERASKQLAAKWPMAVEFRPKKDGRPDAKIHWNRLRA